MYKELSPTGTHPSTHDFLRHVLVSLVTETLDLHVIFLGAYNTFELRDRSNFKRGNSQVIAADGLRGKHDVDSHVIYPPLTGGMTAISEALPKGSSHARYSRSIATLQELQICADSFPANLSRTTRGVSVGSTSRNCSARPNNERAWANARTLSCCI
jgi:hypothetical protein